MHDYRSIDNWLYHACKDIRYAPDCAAVQAELRAHYEDAFDSLTGSGMTEADAKELALRGLGDADELAPALAKAHNSIWTVIWRVSRWLARLSLAVLLWYVFCFVIPDSGAIYWYQYGDLTPQTWAQEQDVAAVACGTRGVYAGYDWEITEWARKGDTLVFELVLRDHSLSPGDPITSFWRLILRDDTGEEYAFTNGMVGIANGSGSANFAFLHERSARFFTRYTYTLMFEGVLNGTDWVELCVQDSDFALRIDLTKGEGRG